MKELFVLLLRIKEVLRVRVRAEHHSPSLDVSFRGLDIPFPVIGLVDARHGGVRKELTVGIRRLDCFAHERCAQSMPGRNVQ